MQDLLSIPGISESREKLYAELTEVVDLSGDITIDDLIKRLDACKRALSIANKLPLDQGKKKWLSATFVNLNKVNGMLKTMMKQQGIQE